VLAAEVLDVGLHRLHPPALSWLILPEHAQQGSASRG
jgi:hypothetical protein